MTTADAAWIDKHFGPAAHRRCAASERLIRFPRSPRACGSNCTSAIARSKSFGARSVNCAANLPSSGVLPKSCSGSTSLKGNAARICASQLDRTRLWDLAGVSAVTVRLMSALSPAFLLSDWVVHVGGAEQARDLLIVFRAFHMKLARRSRLAGRRLRRRSRRCGRRNARIVDRVAREPTRSINATTSGTGTILPVVVRLTTRENMNAGAAADIRGPRGMCEGTAHSEPCRSYVKGTRKLGKNL